MSLDCSITELYASVMQLERAFDHLYWAIVEGQEQVEEQHSLVSRYEAVATDLLGEIRTTREAMTHQNTNTFEVIEAWEMTLKVQELSHHLHQRFYDEMVSFEPLDELRELARQRAEQWAGWVNGTTDALSECREPLYKINETLLHCWQELSTPSLMADRQKSLIKHPKPAIRLVGELRKKA
jgi:hypothetical protein